VCVYTHTHIYTYIYIYVYYVWASIYAWCVQVHISVFVMDEGGERRGRKGEEEKREER